jgi:hypothetical protein
MISFQRNKYVKTIESLKTSILTIVKRKSCILEKKTVMKGLNLKFIYITFYLSLFIYGLFNDNVNSYIIYYIPYYAILYYTILYYTILYYTILYYTILHYTTLHSTKLYSTLLYSTLLYSTLLYSTLLHSLAFLESSGNNWLVGMWTGVVMA